MLSSPDPAELLRRDDRPRQTPESTRCAAATGDLADHYTALADDGQHGTKKREAAVLLSVAEGHLEEDEDVEEALRAGKEALGIFRDVGDKEGTVDALRVVIDAMSLQASQKHEKPDAAEDMAAKELEDFKKVGDKRGQAAMLIALARVNNFRTGSKYRQQAMRQANEAVRTYREIGDKKMEAIALLALTEVHIQMRSYPEAVGQANRALEIAKEQQDKKGEARALHSLGVARFSNEQQEIATQASKAALALYKELGMKKQEALEHLAIAQWQLEEENIRESLAAGKEAVAMFAELAHGKPLHLRALRTLVLAYVANKDGDTAAKLVKKELTGFRQAQDQVAEVETLGLLAETLLKNKDLAQALLRAEEGLSIARDMKSRRHQAAALQTIAQVQLEAKEYVEVLQVVREAVQLFRDMEEPIDEGCAQHLAVMVHVKKEKWEDAMKAAKEAQEVFHKAGERHIEGKALLVIAALHFMLEEYKPAVSEATEAKFLFEEEKDRGFQSLAQHHIAEYHTLCENFPAALRVENKAFALMRELDNKANLAVVMSTLALIKLGILVQSAEESTKLPAKDMADPVKKAIEEAKALTEKTTFAKQRETWDVERKQLVASNWFALAQLHITMQETVEAQAAIDEGEALAKKAQDEEQEVVAMILTTYVLILEGKESKATTIADQALELSKRIPFEFGEHLANNAKEIIAAQIEGKEGGAKGSEGEKLPEVDPEMLKLKINDVANSLMGIESLASDTPLMDAGLDSLSMVEFRNELVKEFPGVDLPGALLFDYPTVNALTDFIATGLKGKALQ